MARKPAATKPSTAPAPQPARRDIRPYIYLALNQIFAVAYFYAVIAAIPNRLPTAKVNLYAVPVLMQLITLGAAAVFLPALRRIGWWIVVVGNSLLVAVTIVLIARVLISAAFLSGVYGAFGKAAAMTALMGVAIVVEIVGLLPLFQIRYMRSRAGRRAYDLG
ncbi:MAG TPA: hypothetical protein VLB44_02165 [Kofleriaceae bacterium]|nr:hypothetical protein [Kofleriaceae bacterium]